VIYTPTTCHNNNTFRDTHLPPQTRLCAKHLRGITIQMLCCAAIKPGGPGLAAPPPQQKESEATLEALLLAVPGSGAQPQLPLHRPELIYKHINSCLVSGPELRLGWRPHAHRSGRQSILNPLQSPPHRLPPLCPL
jgi:hypothetical protein